MGLLKKFAGLGMNVNSDRFILPDQYAKVETEPNYRAGCHSVDELEKICMQYKEYCHQQAVIKQRLIEEIRTS